MNIREFHNSNINSDNIAVLVASRGGNGSMPGEPLLWTEAGDDGEIYVGDSNHTPSIDVGERAAASIVNEWLSAVGDANSVDIDSDVSDIDDDVVSKLRDEAGAAGDSAQVAICDFALDGNDFARVQCGAVIAAARDMASY